MLGNIGNIGGGPSQFCQPSAKCYYLGTGPVRRFFEVHWVNIFVHIMQVFRSWIIKYIKRYNT